MTTYKSYYQADEVAIYVYSAEQISTAVLKEYSKRDQKTDRKKKRRVNMLCSDWHDRKISIKISVVVARW